PVRTRSMDLGDGDGVGDDGADAGTRQTGDVGVRGRSRTDAVRSRPALFVLTLTLFVLELTQLVLALRARSRSHAVRSRGNLPTRSGERSAKPPNDRRQFQNEGRGPRTIAEAPERSA